MSYFSSKFLQVSFFGSVTGAAGHQGQGAGAGDGRRVGKTEGGGEV